MSELGDAKKRLDDGIKWLRYLRTHIEEIHDCGYTGAGKSADGSGRSQRFHYYGDSVGDKRWRAAWRDVAGFLGLRYRGGDRYTELMRLARSVEKLINDGPPLTADEYNALVEHEEKRGKL